MNMVYAYKIKPYIQDYVLWAFILIGLIGITIHACFGYSAQNAGHAIGNDDAYITYRYAENFYKGFGLVFNKGERVEGYSNFLYLILMTPSFFFGRNNVYFYSLILNSILFSLSIFLFFDLVKNSTDRITALISSSILSINPWIWLNVASGLETTLVFLLFILILKFIDDFKKIKLLLIFLTLTILSRIDGFVIAFFVCLYLLANKRYIHFCLSSLFISSVFAIQSLFRYLYYGNFISNTFYAKFYNIDLNHKISYACFYFFKNLLFTGLWFLFFITAYLSLKRMLKGNFDKIMFYQLFPMLWVCYIFMIGGDNYNERFLLILIPCLLYAVCCLSSIKKQVLITTFFLQIIFVPIDERFHYVLNKYDPRIAVGDFIKKHYPNRIIAVDAAGKIPFFSEAKTIDILGLTDPHISRKTVKKEDAFIPGHIKYDPVYVLNKEPDLIMSWIQENGDLFWGMTHEKYSKNYFLRYLVNFNKKNRGEKNIIDVKGMHAEDIQILIKDKYIFAILEKKHP